MKFHGLNPTPKCPLYGAFVNDFDALAKITLPSAHTILLIAADARDVSSETVDRVAERLQGLGLIYVCVWGPDCERVHDIFDWAHVGDGTAEPSFTWMSTWHHDQPLNEAIHFFLECAFPPDVETKTVSYVAVAVGDKNWMATIDEALSDPSGFINHMVQED